MKLSNIGGIWEASGKPPFFSTNLATKYKYWVNARPGGIWMTLLIIWSMPEKEPDVLPQEAEEHLHQRDCQTVDAAITSAMTSVLPSLDRPSRSIKFKTTIFSEQTLNIALFRSFKNHYQAWNHVQTYLTKLNFQNKPFQAKTSLPLTAAEFKSHPENTSFTRKIGPTNHITKT